MANFSYKDGRPEIVFFLEDAANEAADAKIAYLKKLGYKFDGMDEDEMHSKYANDYYRRLSKNLEGTDYDERNIRDLEAMTGADALAWLEQGGNDPFTLAKANEFKKWSPLLQRDENGKPAWQSMSTDELAADALSKGYRWYDMKDRSAYMDKIRDLDTEYSRGLVVNEELNSPGGILTQMVAPTATEEAVEQSMGKEGTDQDVYNALGVDALADILMAKTPSLSIFKGRPVVNGAIDAVAQGLEESGRSIAGDKLQGKDVDFGKVAVTGGTSAGLAATVPGLVGLASGTFSSLPGMRNVGRGLSMSTRAADPVVEERSAIERALKAAKDFKGNNKTTLNPKNERISAEAKRGEEYRSALGGGDDGSVLGAYDRTAEGEGLLNPDLNIDATGPEREAYENAKRLFPAATEAAKDAGTVTDKAKKMGKVLLETGGRVEPIVQGIPLKNSRTTDYKQTEWYKKLPKSAKEAIDEAMKKKADED